MLTALKLKHFQILHYIMYKDVFNILLNEISLNSQFMYFYFSYVSTSQQVRQQ